MGGGTCFCVFLSPLYYTGLAFNLGQTTVNADRHRLFRIRLKSVEALAEYVTRATIELAYKRAKEMCGVVTGLKSWECSG